MNRSFLYLLIMLIGMLFASCGKGKGEEPTEPAPQETTGAPASSETPRYSGAFARVSVRLSYPSVVGAGFPMSEALLDPEAKAYRAKLEEKQREIVRQIEEHCGEEIELYWQMTLTSDVISIRVREAALEWIRSLPEVVAAEIEGQAEPDLKP